MVIYAASIIMGLWLGILLKRVRVADGEFQKPLV